MLDFPILAYAGVGGDGQGSFALLFLFLFIALGISFLCSILEAILLTSSLSHIETLVAAGKRAGKLMQKHKQDVERPISAILTLNTIAHTVGAAGVGAEATALFGEASFGIISAILTLLILVLSEIIPKTLGATYWKQLTGFAAYTIELLVKALYPFVIIFDALARLLSPHVKMPTITRSEIEVMARIGGAEGALEAREERILMNMFNLRDVPVETIMTPRTVMMALQRNLSVGEVLAEYRSLPYSRIPTYNETADDIEAYVLRHDIYKHASKDQDHVVLKNIARKIHAIPETLNVAEALDQFIEQKDHIFLVVDEYGGTAGILTLEDTVETLLGREITDESDVHEDMREFAEQQSRLSHPDQEVPFDSANSGASPANLPVAK